MSEHAVYGQEDRRYSYNGVLGQAMLAVARLYPVPPTDTTALLVAGAVLGAVADVLLRAPGPPGLNLSLWIASVAVAAHALHRRGGLPQDRERVTWLATGVVFAAGLAWRDAPPLKLLALGCATLTFALAAYRPAAAWVRRAGVVRYVGALVLGAVHAWTAAALALVDVARFIPRAAARHAPRWNRAAAITRGLLIAAPLLLIFGGLFMSADAVFAELVSSVLRFDFGPIAGHIALFSIGAWLSTGYLRGFLTGTALRPLQGRSLVIDGGSGSALKRPVLGITEVATAMAAVDLLFLVFVIVQYRYLFGGDTLVLITPDLTYADYARRGFFELVFAAVLVVPVLLAADWFLQPRLRRDAAVFRSLAGIQIGLVLAIAASAFQRLRLYHASYGLTESRFYAMVLLLWVGAMLFWLAATVLRGRRDLFAAAALISGLVTVALLFAVNPDAIVVRANLARMASADAAGQFDASYAASLSADAVPVLIGGLSELPSDVQCPIARHILRRWAPDRERSIRSWNWSASRASDAVREHGASLRSMLGPGEQCASAAVR
jgi:hypothetical protein